MVPFGGNEGDETMRDLLGNEDDEEEHLDSEALEERRIAENRAKCRKDC